MRSDGCSRRPRSVTASTRPSRVTSGSGTISPRRCSRSEKRADGRAFRYRPARPEGRVITSLVREFVDRVFDGASRPLLAHLVTQGRLTKEEREELKRLIDEAE